MIEEAYEVVDAIDSSPEKLCEELGDLLLQVVLHAQIALQQGHFDIADVIRTVSEKLVRRHPHVFGNVKADTAEQVLRNWEAIKQGETNGESGALDSVPRSLPALMRSQRLGDKAARIGFDWPNTKSVKDKIHEEMNEFLAAASDCAQAQEFGDVLFSLVQWARKSGISAEEALQGANSKFSSRFREMELSSSRPLNQLSPEELEELWLAAKQKMAGMKSA